MLTQGHGRNETRGKGYREYTAASLFFLNVKYMAAIYQYWTLFKVTKTSSCDNIYNLPSSRNFTKICTFKYR